MGERARTDLKPLIFSGGVDTEVEPNEYDKVRKAVPFRESRSLPIGARTLSTEMSCPICLDLLSQTMTAKECLHRFCSECITMALQRGNKECPTCRKKLVSKRSLRPDPAFDLLIQKVWPDRSIYENLQQHEHNLAREESPDEDDSPTEFNADGVPQPKKKKTSSYDPESLMEYFLAQQQSRRQKAEEEEFPELNGEQAFLEREAIDNLLENGTMHEYEDFNEDDDVYGDELELDEAGNVIESGHKNNNNDDGDAIDESQGDDAGESGEYDPYAYSEENEEDFDEYEGFDSMAALTPEQQEELQADLEELEAIEYEVYELDFSDEEVEEEGDQLPENVEEVNGMRYRSSDESSDEEDVAAAKKAIVEETVETSDSSSSSSSSDSSEDKEEETIDRDATPPAYAPEMNAGQTDDKIDEPMETDTPEKAKTECSGSRSNSTSLLPIGHPPPSQPSPIINTILPPRPLASEPSLYSSGVPLPSAADVGEMPRVEFTPPPEDDDSLPGPIFDVANAPLNSVIAIAPSSTTFGGMIIKEERLSPTPPNVTAASNEITITEEEDDDSSDSTSTTYSSSGNTSTLSTVSSVVSMDFSEGNDEEVAAINIGMEMITEGDFQMPASSNAAASSNSSSYQASSTSIKPAATSLTVYSEDLPPHREEDPVKDEVISDEHRPPSSTIPPSDRLNHWLATNPCSPISVEEDMTEMPQRRVDDCYITETVSGSEEIEAELLPASSLLQRDCPDELLVPRYVRAKHDTKMAHLAEFVHERALEEFQSNQKDFDADPDPILPKPIHFYVFSRNEGHHVKQIFLHETMATALCAMTQGDHLIIFYDIAGIDLRGEKPGSLLADVVPSHFLSLPPVYL